MSLNVPVLPVIMAGGSGTRLWPLSRAGYPKQFLVLSGNRSLFQQAVSRLLDLGDPALDIRPPLVVGNEEHRFLVLDQLREIGVEPEAVVLEPLGRNTAPALTLAALQATADGADPVLIVTPADQTVTRPDAFSAALRRAVAVAADGGIAILGIVPDRPETGYGYIRASRPEGGGESPVQRFVEKPDAATAERYLAEGGYCWNAGMFVLRASVWLAALERFRPDIAAACRAAWAPRSTDARFVRPGKVEFTAVPSESVDYAVMERCPGSDIDIRVVYVEPPFQASGRVAWCNRIDDRYDVGIELTCWQEKDWLRVVEQICEIERYRRQIQKAQACQLSIEQAAERWYAQRVGAS